MYKRALLSFKQKLLLYSYLLSWHISYCQHTVDTRLDMSIALQDTKHHLGIGASGCTHSHQCSLKMRIQCQHDCGNIDKDGSWLWCLIDAQQDTMF